MKTKATLVLLLLLGLSMAISAQDKPPKIKKYNVWLTYTNVQGRMEKVNLLEIKDSSVIVSSPMKNGDGFSYSTDRREVFYSEINVIRTRRKGSIAVGGAIGASAGLLIGAFGYLSGDDPPSSLSFSAEEKFVALSVPSVIVLTPIGIAFGASKRKTGIYGSFENFSRYRETLKKYSVIK